MITHFVTELPCGVCGQTHEVPLDHHGQQLVMLCGGNPQRMEVDVAAFKHLSEKYGLDQPEAIDARMFVIHTVGPADVDPVTRRGTQRCDQCGQIIVEQGKNWWPDNTMVGERESDETRWSYLASLPLSPMRERWCHQRRAH